MKKLEKAKKILIEGEYTCVICGEETYTATKRGVAPLLDLLESGADMAGASAADKVVGRAAAFLYVLLKVSEIYAGVISKTALEVLKKEGIHVEYDQCVEAIFNRDNTGFCPMETAVMGIDEAESALLAIKNKLKILKAAN